MAGHDDRPPFPARLGSEPDSDSLEEVWNLLEGAEPDGARDSQGSELDEAWARLAGEIGALETEAGGEAQNARIADVPRTAQAEVSERSASPSWFRWGAVAVAAAAAVFVLVGPPATVNVEAGPGETRSVALSDGSMVELNSGSTLSYARWTRGDSPRARRVRLIGEAFFEVAPGAAAFQVQTLNAEVTVLGTRFNVRARDELGGGTEVVVASGRVRLAAPGIETGVELEGGESSMLSLGSTEPSPPSATALDPILSWRTRGFAAVDRPLGSILSELERRFDTRLEVDPGVALDERLTIHYHEPRGLESILSDIATARGLGYRAISGGYEIHP